MENKEIEKFEQKNNSEVDVFLQQLEVYKIDNQSDFEDSVKKIQVAKNRIKTIDIEMKDPCEKAHASWLSITGVRGKMREPWERAKEILSGKQNDYKKAEYEKEQKLKREAEAKRREEERKERERLERKAEKEMEKENFEKAEEIIEQSENVFVLETPVFETPKQVIDESGKVASTSILDFDLYITDLNLVLKATIDRKLPKFQVKDKKIVLTLSDIKKRVKGDELTLKECLEIGLRKEIKFNTKIY